MQLVVTYDPDTEVISVFIGERGYSTADDGRLRKAVIELLEREPGLITDWGGEGRMMSVSSHADNAGKLLASLHMTLEYGSPARTLTAEIWCDLKEQEELQGAFDEYFHTVGCYGTEEEREALYST